MQLSKFSGRGVYISPSATIGKNVRIGDNTVIYDNVIIGDNTIICNNCIIGEPLNEYYFNEGKYENPQTTIGRIQGYSEFGDYVRMHSNVHIGQHSKVGNYCWIYPYTVFTNDPTPPSDICIGPSIGDYSIVATHCLILPGVNIGSNCLIGAFTSVTKDIKDYQVVIGSPGKVVKDIREVKDRQTGEPYYPWPYRFDRNMPWKGLDYELWLNK